MHEDPHTQCYSVADTEDLSTTTSNTHLFITYVGGVKTPKVNVALNKYMDQSADFKSALRLHQGERDFAEKGMYC